MSQHDDILSYLKRGGRLTVLSALNMFGCYALSQRIGELKEQGHRIESRTIKTPNGKHVSEYHLLADGKLF